MARPLRHHIHEGNNRIILVDAVRGDLAAQDLGEDVVGIVGGLGHGEAPNCVSRLV